MKNFKKIEVGSDKLSSLEFPVQQVFVIHDHIYETKQEAKAYEDGKDIAKSFYIIRDEDYENGMESDRVMLYETEQEAKLEFLEMEHPDLIEALQNKKEEVLMNKDTALKVIQQGWGKGYMFQSEDEHGIYFESEHEEVKMVMDAYPETGVYSVYGRPKDAEDWDLWDNLNKEDVEWYLKESDKEDERQQESTEKIYWYEMTSRPISPGAQPDGFVDWKENKGRHGLVAYNRALTERELNDFEMKEWVEEREMSSYEILEEARTIQENYGFSPYEVEWDNEVFQDYLKEIDPEEHKRFNDLKGQFEKQSKKEKIDETFMERE